jgi:MATE family multidrug resistance protein
MVVKIPNEVRIMISNADRVEEGSIPTTSSSTDGLAHENRISSKHRPDPDRRRLLETEVTAKEITASSATTRTFRQEIWMLVQLAVPTCCIQLGFTVPPFLTAGYVGRTYGPAALDGFQLANLVCNLFTLSLLQGLYSASDTLSPQAFGAGNYREVGLVALRGLVASCFVVVPICTLLSFQMELLLVGFGEDPDASRYAHEWYCMYIWSLPFYVLYVVTWKFLSAQNVMLPLVLASATSCAVVLPVALELLTSWMGFVGSAAAIVVFQASQAGISLGYVALRKPHRPGTWPGFLDGSVWRDVFRWEPFRVFFYLGMGGIVVRLECGLCFERVCAVWVPARAPISPSPDAP